MSESVDLHRDRGLEFYEEGKFTEAIAEWREALRINPRDANLYKWLGHCLGVEAEKVQDKDGWEAAAAAFQKAIDIDPASSYAHHSLGALNWKLGKKREAISALKAAVIADPNNAAAYIQLWELQGCMWDIPGMARTIKAMNKLPASEDMDQHYANMSREWPRLRGILLIGAGVIAVLIGALIWNRRRKD